MQALCHPEKKHHAKGLCADCYGKQYENLDRATCHPDRPKKTKDGLCGACYAAQYREQKRNPHKATCHPDRPHMAKGLCAVCYVAQHHKNQENSVKATCHPEKAHWAKGLCHTCYKREQGRKARREYKAQRKNAGKTFIQSYLQTHLCVDCGVSNPIVLDFHHRRPEEKIREVSDMIAERIEIIQQEIEKCDVVCSNCHRIRHAKERELKRSTDNSISI